MADCGCDAVVLRKPLTPYEEAIDRILDQAKRLSEIETVSLNEAAGRVLAEAVVSPVNVPPADNSAMDGYAVRAQDIQAGARLPVSQRIPAGVMGDPLEANTVARIFTGAPVPANADAVIMQEWVNIDEDGMANFDRTIDVGNDIRRAGEDIKEGDSILEPGLKLRPQDIGLAASVGVNELKVYRRLKVATFFTGDELVEPGNALGKGQIYNSNQYTVNSLLDNLDCEIVNLGIVEDTLDATRNALSKAAESADLIITSGGVSVGEEDHVRIALEELGQLSMWKLRIKPGKPLALGNIHDTDFFGLPGNPVSAFATFVLFVRPFIRKVQGEAAYLPTKIEGVADFEWPKAGPRREFLRARISDGSKISIYPHQGSGVLSSTSWADGFAIVYEDTTVTKGDKVEFIPYSELLA